MPKCSSALLPGQCLKSLEVTYPVTDFGLSFPVCYTDWADFLESRLTTGGISYSHENFL